MCLSFCQVSALGYTSKPCGSREIAALSARGTIHQRGLLYSAQVVPIFRNSETMSSIVKIQDKGQVTIPTHLRTQAGLAKGDLVEAAFERGRIVLTPKAVINRTPAPAADLEYTAAQRRAIDRGIAQSMKEYQKGRGIGPFHSHEEFIAALERKPGKRPRKPARSRR